MNYKKLHQKLITSGENVVAETLENEIIINPIVFKDFYCNDFLAYILNNKEIFIRNIYDFSIQVRIESNSEINYLCPGGDMKVLYAFNKNGTQIDVILCDTKKVSEENL